MSELTRRILFGVIGAPAMIAIIYAGDAVLATAVSVIAAIGAWEFCRIARAAGAEPFDWVAIVAAAAIPLIVHGTYNHKLAPNVTYFVIAALTIFAIAIFARGPERRPLIAASTTIFGIAYVSMLTYLYTIRYHDYVVDAAGGTVLVMLPVILTWGSDIGGFMFGRMFGKRKLIPSVSPGKTVAGALGGLLLTIVLCAVYVTWVLRPVAQLAMTSLGIVICAITISAVAQLGDLAESLIKREAGIKDSSHLFPGHGGVLDRFDSMLFVLPVAQLLLSLLLIPAPRP